MENDAYYPENTETKMYLLGDDNDLDTIIEFCQNKWGEDVDFSKLNIRTERIQIYGNSYSEDSGDYANFLVIEKA